jgi:hypothetical protein
MSFRSPTSCHSDLPLHVIPSAARNPHNPPLNQALTHERNMPHCALIVPAIAQILPFRIQRFNQGNLLTPPPPLDLLLPGNGCGDIARFFKIHQASDVIFLGEPLNQLVLVFIDPALQVIGRAGVKCA